MTFVVAHYSGFGAVPCRSPFSITPYSLAPCTFWERRKKTYRRVRGGTRSKNEEEEKEDAGDRGVGGDAWGSPAEAGWEYSG